MAKAVVRNKSKVVEGSGKKTFSSLPREAQLQVVADLQASLPPLKTLLSEKKAAWTKYGDSLGDIKEKEAGVRQDYSKFRGVLADTQERLESGGEVNIAEVARSNDTRPRVVSDWLNRNKRPLFLAKRPSSSINIPTQEDPEFAFLLGYMLGQMGELAGSRINMRNNDEDVVRRLSNEVNRIRDSKTSYTTRGNSHTIDIRWPEMLEYVNNATSGKKHIPLSHVITEKERIAGLQGFFSTPNTGQVTHHKYGGKRHPGLRVSRLISTTKNQPSGFLTDMQIICMKLGITSIVFRQSEKESIWVFEVNELNSLQRMLDLNILPKEQAQKLVQEIDRSGRTKRSFSPAQYDAVMEHKPRMPEGGRAPHNFFKNITDQVNEQMRVRAERGEVTITSTLDRDRVREWLTGSKPTIVKSRDKIRAMEKKQYGNIDEIERLEGSQNIVIDSSGKLPDPMELRPPINLDHYNQKRDEPQLIEWLLSMDVSRVQRKTMAVYPEKMVEDRRADVAERLEKYGGDLGGISEEDRKYAMRYGVEFRTQTIDTIRRIGIRDFLIKQFGSIRWIGDNISAEGLAKLGFKIETFGTQYNLTAIKSSKK